MNEHSPIKISAGRFLSGNDDISRLIRSHNWEQTSIGPIDRWPQSLRTALNISLNSNDPVVILWGSEMIRIYNNAYAKLIGKKHPGLMGSKGNELLPEVWGVVEKKLEAVFNNGVSGSEENILILLDRKGYKEECYFSLNYHPIFDEAGEVGGVYLVISETTGNVLSDKRLRALRDKQLANLFIQAPIAISIFRGPQYIIETVNNPMLELWGKTAEQVINKPVLEALPEIAGQGFQASLENVYKTGERFVAEEMPVKFIRKGEMEQSYVKFVYEALREEDGTISAIMALADEITPLVSSRKAIEESEERLRMAIESTKLGTWDYDPVSGELNWSDECRAIYAFPPDKKIDFEDFSNHIFPEDKEYVLSEIEKAMKPTGTGHYDITYRIIRYTDKSPRWIRATGKVYFNVQHKADRFIGTVVDITESRELEEALRNNEQRLRLAVEAAQMGTFDWDIKASKFIYSERLARIFGYEDTKGLDQNSFGDRIHEDDKEVRLLAQHESFKTGVLFYETKIVWPDTSIHWVRMNGKVMYDKEGRPERMHGTVLDVTEQRKIMRELEESESRFKTLADTAPVMIWTSGPDKKFDFFNKGWLDFTGDTSDEPGTKVWKDFVHPEDLERCTDTYNNAFEARKKFTLEYRMKRQDGKYRWVSDEGTPRYSSDDLFLGYIGACIDIQERKMAREELERKVLERTSELNKRNIELREQKEFVDTILESSVDVITVLDTDLRYVTLNKYACEVYSVTKEELIGKHMIDVFPLIKTSGMYDDLQKALKGKTVHDPKYKSTVLDKHFENFYIPLKDRNDKVYGVLLLSHDNTAIVKAAEKLEATNRQLEEKNLALERSNKELESFSYVASHDLQEPLRKIRTFAELVRKNIHDEETVNKYFGKIDSSAQRMADLIKAVLNYSRLSRTDEHFVQTDLNEILRNVISDFELLITEKSVKIKIEKLPVIKGIPLQLNQLFSNLVGNSIKFSEKAPEIIISASEITADEMPQHPDIHRGSNYVELRFKDNGIGFEQQYSNQIFTIFKRLHGNQEYNGTGIGLALCKKIVENHGGLIAVQSEPGKGTEFFIYLPVN